MLKTCAAFITTLLSAAALNCAQAYQFSTPYQSEHFALHQIILDEHETFDEELRYEITRQVQTQNRISKHYQSSAAVFPYGSVGLASTISEKMLGVLSISNYGTGSDQIVFNSSASSASQAGLYISFTMLRDFIDNKVLNPLLGELLRLPLIITDIPVSAVGYDQAGNFYATARNKAVILDLRLADSVYYSKQELRTLSPDCSLDALIFTERVMRDLPLFISARAAANHINCNDSKEESAK